MWLYNEPHLDMLPQVHQVLTCGSCLLLCTGLMACLLHITHAIHNQSRPTGSYAVAVLFGIANTLVVSRCQWHGYLLCCASPE